MNFFKNYEKLFRWSIRFFYITAFFAVGPKMMLSNQFATITVASSGGTSYQTPTLVNFGDLTSGNSSYEFYMTAIRGGAQATIAGNSSFAIRLEQWRNRGVFGITRFGVSDSRFTAVQGRSVSSIFGTPVHVVVTNNPSSNSSKLYIDGVLSGNWGGSFLLSGDTYVMSSSNSESMASGSIMHSWTTYSEELSDQQVLLRYNFTTGLTSSVANYQTPSSGYQTGGSGYQTGGSGYQTPSGGNQSPGSGYQSPAGGYQTPTGAWTINPAVYPNNMSMTVLVSINGGIKSSGSLAAFSGAEIRGLQSTPTFPPFGSYSGQGLFQVMVYGDSHSTPLQFKWSPDGTEANSISLSKFGGGNILFINNDNLGTLLNPVSMTGSSPPGSGYQTPSSGYQTGGGNYQSGGASYQSGGTGYQTPSGGYQTPVSGYQTGGAGYQSTGSGYQTGISGYQTSVSGYQSEGTGYQIPVGGFQTGAGAYQTGAAAYQSSGAGYQPTNAGYQTQVGGFQTAGGGFQTPGSGYQTVAGGFQSSGSGYQTPGSGYQSGAGGFHSGVAEDLSAPVKKPVVSTIGYQAFQSQATLAGEILNKSESEFKGIEVGFLVSSKLQIDLTDQTTKKIRAYLGNNGQFSAIYKSSLNQVVFFKAFAENSLGISYGNVKKISISASTDSQNQSALEKALLILSNGSTEMAGGWNQNPWFGLYRSAGNGWVYHSNLGWLYLSSDDYTGIWMWLQPRGWLWTTKELYPFHYQSNLGDWIYFFKGRNNENYFFNYSTNSIENIIQ